MSDRDPSNESDDTVDREELEGDADRGDEAFTEATTSASGAGSLPPDPLVHDEDDEIDIERERADGEV